MRNFSELELRELGALGAALEGTDISVVRGSTGHLTLVAVMERVWEYITISVPERIRQSCQQRREVARLIAEQRQSGVSVVDKIMISFRYHTT